MKQHIAWRFSPQGNIMYVSGVHNGKGDRYSYTSNQEDAYKMTEHQCRLFCSYMKDCATIGFWS